VNLTCSQKSLSLKGHGGVHLLGGTIQQIPYFSACGRMQAIYPSVSLNSCIEKADGYSYK
jgi:hypothetical protein